jgi:hypothetical protein
MTTALFNTDSSIFHIQNFKWKGMTFNQISSIYKKNINTVKMTKELVNKALPLKIYRKEIAVNNGTQNMNCSRKRVSIDELNMPNGYIIPVPTDKAIQIGLVNTMDINYSNSKYDHPGTCATLSSQNVCLSQEQNAKTRVRSSGMIRKKYNINDTTDNYNTSTNQYLTSRNRTFAQNQYNYVRFGSALGKPGDSLTLGNIYSPQGLTNCTKLFLASDVTFSYKVPLSENIIAVTQFDISMSSSYTVTIPGQKYYNINDINTIFQTTMIANNTYYKNKITGANVFLMNLTYNTIKGVVELQYNYTNTLYYPSTTFQLPINTPNIIIPIHTGSPIITITTSSAYLFNIPTGDYPKSPEINVNNIISNSPSSNITNIIYSGPNPGLAPPYVALNYKPNNTQYAKQGGVTSSERILRLKYNTITKNAGLFNTILGQSVGNALAYGVSNEAYTVKTKMGYPTICAPTFHPTTGKQVNCKTYIYRY